MDVTFQMDDSSGLGPNGFNENFYEHPRKDLKEELFQAVSHVFKIRKFTKEINHTFITLIPKSMSADSTNDYRPKSCCNVIYKIITNIICNRIRGLLNDLISANQNAYIPGRCKSENSLLAHEMKEVSIEGMAKTCA